jgi:phosphoglycolate phosphatase-like HAD superfamily hydrolase
VLYCLAKAGVARGVFVGDSDTDIAAARATQMPCLLALFGYGPMQRRAEAAAFFSAYEELPALVRAAAR